MMKVEFNDLTTLFSNGKICGYFKRDSIVFITKARAILRVLEYSLSKKRCHE